jgi:chromosomal replication initiation ATPase DnaA
MSEKTEVEELLKNIHQGLKKVGLKELNTGILKFLNTKNDKSEEIDFVLQLVCKEYSLSIHSLKSKYPKGLVQDAKQVAYCLLHFNLQLTIRYIAEKIFMNWPTSVYTGVKRYKEGDINHKADKDFMEKYNKLEKLVIEHITNFK